MKKFTKVCLILGVTLLILGTGISVAAAAMGATLYDLPSINYSYRNSWNWDHDYDRINDNELGEWNGWDTLDYGENTYAEIKDMDITVSGGTVEMKTSDTISEIQIKTYEGNGSCQVYVEDGTLKIKARWRNEQFLNNWNNDHPRILITVPKGYEFDDVNVDVSAGEFLSDEIIASELDIDMAAGSAAFGDGTVELLSIDCKAGEVLYAGVVSREVETDCSAGNVELQLSGQEQDYNYRIQATAGSIQIGDSSLEGITSTRKIDNNASGNMDLQCSAGSINVTFQN